jgi:deoxycytidylate deaminase
MSDESAVKHPELVFGLVGAVGTDLEIVSNVLSDSLSNVGYSTNRIRLSQLLAELPLGKDLPSRPEEDRLAAFMTAGNQLREQTQRGDALALLAISKIRALRREFHQGDEPSRPIPRCAYILRSLKHDSEVDRLRRIYGPGFFLVAAYSPYQVRLDSLAQSIAQSHESAEKSRYQHVANELIDRDRFEPSTPHGQRVRETFKKADVFVDVRDEGTAKKSLGRFVEILFGHPYHTPTKHEHVMFHAHASAVRSASLARQVGAVIANRDGEIIATGTNEVPRASGGLYWPEDGPRDARDFQKGYDSNTRMKIDAVREVLSVLGRKGWFRWELDAQGAPPPDRLQEACRDLEDSRVMNLTEFGREVHAEMAALLDAAKRGVSVQGCTLYCTTFPCHNCAKHIVAAGICEVFYIEPYPKSVAPELYEDSIAVDGQREDGWRIPFRPFVGIGARRYMDLFSVVNSEGWVVERKDADGRVLGWNAREAFPRLPMWDRSYLEREMINLKNFEESAKTVVGVAEGRPQ